MTKFKPTWVECLLKADSYRYDCTVPHKNELGHDIKNTYRFSGKPLIYLVKDKEDYEEMITLDIFEDHVAPEEKEKSAKSETTKERKLREKAEAEANKEAAEELEKMTPEEKESNPEVEPEGEEEKPEEGE